MPYGRSDAPAAVPDEETVESLLGLRNLSHKATAAIKPLHELSESQRSRKHLVQPGKRRERIQGDPFGIWPSWAGKVAHPEDERMFDITRPIFASLMKCRVSNTSEVKSLQSLLEMIPNSEIPLHKIPERVAGSSRKKKPSFVLRDTAEELTLRFTLRPGQRSVRLTQCRDLDVRDEKSYDRSARAAASRYAADSLPLDPPMTAEPTQYLMARLLASRDRYDDLGAHGSFSGSSSGRSASKKSRGGVFYHLRMAAQEEYWLHMSAEQRATARQEALAAFGNKDPADNDDDEDPELDTHLNLVLANWHTAWDSPRWNPDYFRAYLVDQQAAQSVWGYAEEDVVVVVDKHRRVMFANVERLAQTLLGAHAPGLPERCLDMWSFFTALPAPESSRHVVDSYIRRLHPELDPAEATVATLPNAKMCVAHYSTWAALGDPNGRNIMLTSDSTFIRGAKAANPRRLFGEFCRAALGRATEMIRFLVRPLDAEYYADCVEIVRNLEAEDRIVTTGNGDGDDDGDGDFNSLFAFGVNGYTQRHKDRNDIPGGLAGLCTVGRYTGGHLCIPQLNLKVPYQPGACAIIRGTALDHLVQDYSGPRFFLIGTNHESVKRHVWRKLSKSPPPPPRRITRAAAAAAAGGVDDDDAFHGDGDDDTMQTTCVNQGDDADDDIVHTNKQLHESAVLGHESSSSGSTLR